MNPFFDVARFMHACGQQVKEPDRRQLSLYIGLQLEEMAEKLDAIFGPGGSALAARLQDLGMMFKRDDFAAKLAALDRAALCKLVDADFDQIWVSIAALISVGADPAQAWTIGAASNLAKIGPNDEVVKDPDTGKVLKPEGWAPPDFNVALAV